MNNQEMKDATSSPKLSPSSHTRRRAVLISTSIKDSHILEIKHYPDYRALWLVAVILLGYFALMFPMVELPILYFPVLYILLFVYFLLDNRPTNCIVDKQLGQIDYFRGGILGSRFGEQAIHCSISEVKQLKMKRYPGRWSSTFRIVLVLTNGQKLPLSSNKLVSSECKRFATKFCRFLERDIPIKGID